MRLIDAIKETDKLRPNQYPSGKVLKYAMRYVRPNKQLFIQAEVASGTQKGKTYQVRLVFNGILSSDRRTNVCRVKYKDLDGSIYYIQKPTSNHHILTRCSDLDFRFMWHWHVADHKYLLGPRIPYQRKTTHYPEKNPDKIPGICKHILTFIRKLHSTRKITLDAWTLSYLRRSNRDITEKGKRKSTQSKAKSSVKTSRSNRK